MIFYLGLLDLITGFCSLLSFNLGIITGITGTLLTMLLFKGLWSVYTGRTCFPIFVLGILDLITAGAGLLFINFKVLYSIAYLFAFILLVKGFWTTFTTLFK